jgi:glycosyltransferase involved in cell wall biosynthesis
LNSEEERLERERRLIEPRRSAVEDEQRRRLAEVHTELFDLLDRHQQVVNSFWWRMTGPFRAVVRSARGEGPPVRPMLAQQLRAGASFLFRALQTSGLISRPMVERVKGHSRLFGSSPPVGAQHARPDVESADKRRRRRESTGVADGRQHLVLFIDRYVPEPDRDAGSRAILDMLGLFLARGLPVAFWPDEAQRDPQYVQQLEQIGAQVLGSPHDRGDFETWIRENGDRVRYVVLSRPAIALKYLGVVQANLPATIFYYGHDLHSSRLQREYNVTRESKLPNVIKQIQEAELAVCAGSDVILYPSAEECGVIRSEIGAGKSVVEFPVFIFANDDIEHARRCGRAVVDNEPYRLLFVGGFAHAANVDAVLWFVNEVFPKLCAADPRFHFTIAGQKPPRRVRALARHNIRVTGHVSKGVLSALYRTSGLVVVPLRYGAGVKGKVLEAFFNAVPLVSTSVGMQGIPDPGRYAFVADDAEGFAEQIIIAVRDRALAREKVDAAFDLLERKYSREAADRLLAPFIEPSIGI